MIDLSYMFDTIAEGQSNRCTNCTDGERADTKGIYCSFCGEKKLTTDELSLNGFKQMLSGLGLDFKDSTLKRLFRLLCASNIYDRLINLNKQEF
eukprot:UN16797